MTKTSVEWLYDQLTSTWYDKKSSKEILEQAKEMHKKEMIRFAITCHQDILRERKAPENLISENLLLFEEYYLKFNKI